MGGACARCTTSGGAGLTSNTPGGSHAVYAQRSQTECVGRPSGELRSGLPVMGGASGCVDLGADLFCDSADRLGVEG